LFLIVTEQCLHQAKDQAKFSFSLSCQQAGWEEGRTARGWVGHRTAGGEQLHCASLVSYTLLLVVILSSLLLLLLLLLFSCYLNSQASLSHFSLPSQRRRGGEVSEQTQTWKDMEWDLFSWLPGGPWVKRVLFLLLCGVMTLLFVPCMIPCFTLSIRRVINSTLVITSLKKEGNMSIMMLKDWTLQEQTDEIQLLITEETRIGDIKKKIRDCEECFNNSNSCP